MENIKGTKTEANLMAAFAGESQARNKYTFYASKARKEGYVQIANLFEETANNEKEHAKIWFKLLHDGGNRGYRHKPEGRCRRRKLRVDRYVCQLCRGCTRRGLRPHRRPV